MFYHQCRSEKEGGGEETGIIKKARLISNFKKEIVT